MAGKSRRPVSDEQIIEDYNRLRSAPAVAALYGISDQTVYYVLSAHKVPALTRTERRHIKATDADILKAYREIKSGTKVAKQLHINDRTVYRVLAENGIKTGEFHDKPRVFRDPEQVKALVSAYRKGKSAVQLAAEHNCATWTVLAALGKARVKIRRRARIKQDEATQAKELYESGLTLKQTAERLGRSDQGIIYALRRWYPGVIRSADRVGPEGAHWQGGRSIDSQGYAYVWVADDDPMIVMAIKNGRGGRRYVAEHRLVMARKLNRPLRNDETVHHLDGSRTNNDPANLEIRHGRHGKHVVLCCLDCGSRNIGHANLGGSHGH